MRTPHFALAAATAFCCLTTLVSGCGKAKARDSRTLEMTQAPAADSIDKAYQLYGGTQGLTQPEMRNVLARYNGDVDPQLVSFLYDPSKGASQRLTLDDLHTRVPTLSWTTADHPMRTSDLDAKLTALFTNSSKTAREGVAELLSRYDESWAGGNADHTLSQKELLLAGAILGIVKREDFSHGLPARFTKQLGGLSGMADRKVNQQLMTRYPVSDYKSLPPDDLKLEWAQLLIREKLVEKQVKGLKGAQVTDADVTAFLALWGIKTADGEAPKWLRLVHLYEQKLLFGGDGDQKLNALEADNVLTDIEFANATATLFGGDLGIESASQHAQQTETLASYYPKTGAAILLDDAHHPRESVWRSFAPEAKAFSLPDFALALGALSGSEVLFSEFDADRNGLLDRSEATAALKSLGITNSGLLDFLFTGASGAAATSVAPSDLYLKLLGLFAQTS